MPIRVTADVCGIVAITSTDADNLELDITAMNQTLVHRGPDDAGLAVFPAEGIALGMRRLSILDVEGGRQPMWSESRSCALVFNGEIYNYQSLRVQLLAAGHRFATDHSDTEVLVHGYEEWGPDLFARLNGMFALAIWDRPNRQLVVARDFTGEKPLYVGHIQGGFAVASELKALLRHPSISTTIDLDALEQFLAFDFVVGPRTILSGVSKLKAGHYGILRADRFETHRYSSLTFSDSRKPEHDSGELLEHLDHLLDNSVRQRMIADVPVGLFLSGGLDSSTIGYYMRRHSANVESFSIGFEDRSHDESNYAELAARSLGTRHHLEVFSESRIKDLVPHVTDILDEPMADQSIFPTYLLSRFARASVKVALGGDGGDEVLMGYRTYQLLKAHEVLDHLPGFVRGAILKAGSLLPAKPAGAIKSFAMSVNAPPIRRLLNRLGSFRGEAQWVLSPETRANLQASSFHDAVATLADSLPDHASTANLSIAGYIRGYLQEDILVKVDRASMAVSLEVRAPFLDPDLVAFLGTVPPSLKLHGMTRKYLLRQLMRDRLPRAIVDRPKHGFSVPLNNWLRTSLSDLLHDYLDPSRLKRQGLFDHAVVAKMVEKHISGASNYGRQLWPLLLFQLWSDRWLSSRAP